jgi:hypothetical protein
MGLGMYILNPDHTLQEVESEVWGPWMEDNSNRLVAQYEADGVQISTVFLGLDHNYRRGPETRPVLFETMVFGGRLDQSQWRCCTWDEAERQHLIVIGKVNGHG